MDNILDVLFPKTCSICSKKGTYLCERCKKLFKRNLPECYICRKLSGDYKTHRECKDNHPNSSLDSLFVSWEYNSLSSDLIKRYKYKYVYDISSVLCEFFVESIFNSSFSKLFKNTLLTNIPIPSNRLRERGFNQTLNISKAISESFNVNFSDTLLRRKDVYDHQAFKDRGERRDIDRDDFIVKADFDLSNYKSITVVDDVITTGITLERVCEKLKETFGNDIVVNGVCMFRGRAYYV